jgi:hypothetical protein
MAAVIGIKTNISVFSENILAKLKKLTDKEYLLRPVCVELIPQMTERIHQEGKASDGGQIGTYSEAYMRIRTGDFQNADKFQKGANKGKNKNAGYFTSRTIKLDKKTGVFSGDEKVGAARPGYNRSADPKVVVSLTRQLENDWNTGPTEKGYAIMFLNPFNTQKAGWVEDTYGKKIFQLTADEAAYAETRLKKLISDALSS